MRVIWLSTAIILVGAQFEIFTGSNYEDGYSMINDVVGMNDAIGSWGKVLRNMINRNRPPLQKLRETAIEPSHIDIEALKAAPKGNDKIINEKLLYALLPRIKGQPAFTTTTLPTTTTTTTTSTTTTPSTTTTEATTTTKKEEKEETTTANTEATTTISTAEETTTVALPKSAGNGGPQFTVVFRTEDKEILKAKKEGVEVIETDFNGDKEVESTTQEQNKTKDETTKKTTNKPTTSKPKEMKNLEKKDEKIRTTAMPIKMEEEVQMKNALKQKDLDDDEFITTTVWTEETTGPSVESSGEPATEASFLTGETELSTVKTTQKTTTKRPTTVIPKPKKTEQKKDELKKKVNKTAAPKKEVEKDKKVSNNEKKKATTSKEIEEQVEKEATEILELLNKPTTDKRQELSRKLLLEKLKDYLTKQEGTTTTAPSSTMTKQVESNTTKQAKGNDLTTKRITATSATTARITTTTTEEPKKTFSVKKSLRIPEAEEDEKPAFIQEDIPEMTSTTTTIAPKGTTTEFIRATSAAPRSTVYNLNANANSNSNPQIANVITPIAGILDGISPILYPLFGAGSAVNRARVRGIRTYEPTGRDLMADSPGETSIVGFGTQIAREILSPGITKRERQERERALARKIEEAKQLKESKSLIATILDVAKTGPPLELPVVTTVRPFPQGQALPLIPQNYIPLPPPGYQGPLPPTPPPPPPGFVPIGYTGPIPSFQNYYQSTAGPALTVDGTSDQTKNTPYYPPVLQTTTSFPNDEGYQMGRSGVRSTFKEDSGVPMEGNGVILGDVVMNSDMPSISIAAADDSASAPINLSGGSSAGFGGGRKPFASFDEIAGNSKIDNSFITSRKRL